MKAVSLLAAAGLIAAAGPALSQARAAKPMETDGLHGELLSPGGAPRAAALIIAGSGPTDRDGNSPLGVRAGTYRLLAEGLADRGIATLRFDKRGVAASAAAAAREEDLRFETYVDDVRAWAEKLRAEVKADCVWLLGHSEGALVAQVAARDNPRVCGLILVAGAGRKAGDILRDQLSRAMPADAQAPVWAALTELEAGRTVADPPPPPGLFRPSVQPYLISWFKYDPAELLRAYPGPALILSGSTDIQASAADADRLAAAQPRAKQVRLEGVNHVLKAAPADRAANIATYADPALPLAPGVVDAVAAFITSPHRRR